MVISEFFDVCHIDQVALLYAQKSFRFKFSGQLLHLAVKMVAVLSMGDSIQVDHPLIAAQVYNIFLSFFPAVST